MESEIERGIRQALASQALEVVFQPIIDPEQDRVSGMEALLRWKHPVRGYLSPADFIPVAEQAGLMTAIDDWVLLKACQEAVTWPDDVGVSVNISASRLHTPGLVEAVKNALAKSNLHPSRLEIEITETSIVVDLDRARHILQEIRSVGVTIAMDDFGTGYSSLRLLTRLPCERIKIDRSFISNIGDNGVNTAVIRAIIRMGQELHVKITAEGVKNAIQAAWLRGEGELAHQGYLISRPMHKNHVVGWIVNFHSSKNFVQESKYLQSNLEYY